MGNEHYIWKQDEFNVEAIGICNLVLNNGFIFVFRKGLFPSFGKNLISIF